MLVTGISTGYVTGQLIVTVNDGDDEDNRVDQIAPSGWVYLTPRRTAFAAGNPAAAIVVPDRMSLPIDAEGFITVPDTEGNPTGERVIELPAVEGMTWAVTADLTIPPFAWQDGVAHNRVRIPQFDVPVEDGQTTDLAAYLPAGVDPSTGATWVRGPRGLNIGGVDMDGDQLTLILEDGTLLDPVTMPPGPQGDVGPAPNLSIGTVTPGDTTDDAAVTITGASPDYVLNLVLPRGPVGNDGAGIPSGGEAGQVPVRTEDGGTRWEDLPEPVLDEATPTTAGLMPAADKAKLDDYPTVDELRTETISTARIEDRAVTPAKLSEGVRSMISDSSLASARTTIEYKRHNGFPYRLTRIHVDGRPSPNVLHRHVDAPDGSTGSAFRPRQFFINEEIDAVGATFMANASGWLTSGAVGELRGAQIVDGVVRHEMSTRHWQDSDCIGMLPTGRLKAYSAFRGDTTQDLVDDGVLWSVAFGPVLVDGGTATDISDPFWTGRATAKSSMHVLGQRADGDILILTGPGITNSSGTTFADATAIALHEQCEVAMHLDQGGSTQVWAGGVPIIPSSDTGAETSTTSERGRRKIPDAIYTTAPIVSPRVPLGIPAAYASGITTNNDDPLMVYTDGVSVWLSGQARPTTGSFTGTAGIHVGWIPEWLALSRELIGVGNANGANLCKVVVETDGKIMIYPGGVTLHYVVFDTVRTARFFAN